MIGVGLGRTIRRARCRGRYSLVRTRSSCFVILFYGNGGLVRLRMGVKGKEGRRRTGSSRLITSCSLVRSPCCLIVLMKKGKKKNFERVFFRKSTKQEGEGTDQTPRYPTFSSTPSTYPSRTRSRAASRRYRWWCASTQNP